MGHFNRMVVSVFEDELASAIINQVEDIVIYAECLIEDYEDEDLEIDHWKVVKEVTNKIIEFVKNKDNWESSYEENAVERYFYKEEE